jgi:hypothetical protein
MYANARPGENARCMVASILVLHGRCRAAGVSPEWHGRLLAALPYAKRLQLERRAADDRAASLDALGLLCAGLERVGLPATCVRGLRYDEEGAPTLREGLPAISLAHSTLHVACAIAPDLTRVGLDVEAWEPDRVLHAASAARLEHWVATEAVLKAAGQGMRHANEVLFDATGETVGAGQADTAVLRGRHYSLRRVDLGPGSVCRVAVLLDAAPSLRVETIQLDAASVSAAVERALGLAT